MKKFYSVLAATLFAGGITTAALAAGEHGSSTTGTTTGSSTMGSSSTTGSTGMSGSMAGQHMMTGTIDDIDKEEGSLSLKTEEGKTLSLHFPPSAIQDYEEGDRVAVQLGISKQSGAASATGTSESSRGTSGSMGGTSGSSGSMGGTSGSSGSMGGTR